MKNRTQRESNKENTNITNTKRKRSAFTQSNNEHEDTWKSSTGNHDKKLCKFGFFPDALSYSQETTVRETSTVQFIEFMSAILTHHDDMPDYQKTSRFLSQYFANKKLIWPENNAVITMAISLNKDSE